MFLKKDKKSKLIIHPFLFSIYPIFFLYSQNISLVNISEIIIPIIISLTISAFLFFIFKIVFKSYQKSGLLLSLLLLIFYSWNYIIKFILESNTFYIKIGSCLLFLIILMAIVIQTLRTKRKLINITKILNIIAIVLIVMPILTIVEYEFKKTDHIVHNSETALSTLPQQKNKGTTRNIYYIILDGYPSQKVLKEVFNFDNKPFLDFLKNKGFYVAPESKSNYNATKYSLSSSLNMMYINSQHNTPPSADQLWSLLNYNQVVMFLKKMGYKTVNISSGVQDTNTLAAFDLNLGNSIWNEFMNVFIESTPLKYLIPLGKLSFLNRHLKATSILSNIYKGHKKTFIFAHIISPHPPYIFDRNGKYTPPTTFRTGSPGVWLPKSKFIGQLIYTNKWIEKIINKIISNSTEPPIIVLQGDHGPSTTPRGKKLSKLNLQEKMNILNAYYLPGINYKEHLYPTISPVNTFRLIFNLYFGTNFKILPDISFFCGKQIFDVTKHALYQ